MNCLPSKFSTLTVCFAIFACGCSPTKPIYLNDVGDLSYYVDQATKIDYPDVEHPTLDEVTQAHQPMTVIDPDFTSFEDITLEDAVSYTLNNSKVYRGYGTPSLQATRVSPGQDNLANVPGAAATTFNVAIRETEPGFIGQPGQIANPSSIVTNTGLDGNQGVEAALADFDAQLTSSLNYAQTDQPRNTASLLPENQFFRQDLVTWQSEVAKKSANGTQMFFRNVNQYTSNNNPTLAVGGPQALNSWYRASFEAEVRQPLLRGRGAYINRMPIVISRIGTDQELANLEATLQNVVTNVEIRYWDVYCAYRNFEAAKTGRDAALQTWRIVKEQFDEGVEQVNIQQVAQASEQYHFFDAQVIDAYNNLLNAEGQLRYLMGWSSTDGRFLRPIDEPVMAPVEFDWCTSLCEALSYRPELRQERWEIKKRELALAYSKNGLLPELNVSVLYRWLGLGDQYGSSGSPDPFPAAGSGALNDLYDGNYQELEFGGTFAMPIGFRRELANVRNAQLKLARELARIEDMELDITKELAESMRALAANQMIMQSSFNRWKDTTIEEEHFERLKDAGVETLDVALDAQRRRSQAEIAFYTALCEYNKVIALIHRRKGTILPYSGICFAEGPWPGKAYMDSEEHARRRGASRQINYGWSRPQVISRGENWPTGQNTGQVPGAYAIPAHAYAEDYGVAPITESYGDIPLHEVPVQSGQDGQINTVPYYESPSHEIPMPKGYMAPTSTPTPAHQGSQNLVPSKVRQVSYLEDVPAENHQALSQPDATSEVAPVAIRRYPARNKVRIRTIEPAVAQRDTSTQPTQRIQATTPVAADEARAKSGKSKTAVLRTGNLAWEKLGLERPEQSTGKTTATIKLQ